MSNQEIQDERATILAENASILVKSSAVGIAGSIAGLLYANNQKIKGWGKLGCVLAGGYLARLPMALLYTDKLATNLTRLDQLQQMLDQQE